MELDDVAHRLLDRLDTETWITRSRRAQQRVLNDLADWLSEHATDADAGSQLGEWLIDHEAIDDVFASDEELALALTESIAAAAAAPPAAEPADPIDAILAKIERPWYRPKTSPGDGSSTATKFGGRAFIPAGESWPRCGSCGAELPLFVQLDLASLPEELAHPHREGLVQLFYCTSECEVACSAWDAGAKSVVTRWLIPAAEQPITGSPATRASYGFVPSVLERWERQAPELAAYGEELPIDDGERALVDERYEDLRDGDQRCHLGDKLGGWPRWIQGPSIPACPICRTRMRYLLQLDSNGLCGHQFGDLGAGHLFQCPRHVEGLAFTWACH